MSVILEMPIRRHIGNAYASVILEMPIRRHIGNAYASVILEMPIRRSCRKCLYVGHVGNAFASVGIAGFDRRVGIAAMPTPFECSILKDYP